MDSGCVAIFFDYASPYAYIANELLVAIRERLKPKIEWRPIRLLGLAEFSAGLPYSPNRIRYNLADVPRSADFHGVPLRLPSVLPIESERALRLAWLARSTPEFPELHRAIFRAAWAEDRNIGSLKVLGECIEQVGRAGVGMAGAGSSAWLDQIESKEVETALTISTKTANAAGVFGVPMARYRDGLFWGADRLPTLERELQRTQA